MDRVINKLGRLVKKPLNAATIYLPTYMSAKGMRSCGEVGNRTSKTVNGKDTTFYVNDTNGSLIMVAAETDKSGKETASYTRGDELLSMEKDGEVWYYLYDGHGDVSA